MRYLLMLMILFASSIISLQAKQVVLGGESIGIQLKYHGLLVNGHYRLNNGLKVNEHLLKNDRLLKLNNHQLETLSDIHRYLLDNNNKVLVERDGKEILLDFTLVKDNYGYLQHGLYLKEDVLGIATLTYYDKDNKQFAALGHEIVDEEGIIVSFDEGYAYDVNLEQIIPSSKHRIGQKQASFNESIIGTISKNQKEGIFGYLNKNVQSKLVDTANKEDIELGKAYCYVEISEGNIKPYEIEITNINLKTKEVNKGIEIKITDKELIDKCGGIIQGMSGSPILQDGKIIGAVTHVLVNDPTTGYGIFIENMLSAAG